MKSGILIVIEQRNGDVKRASYEAISAASGLAGDLGGEVRAVVIGSDIAAAVEAVSKTGVSSVYAVQAPDLERYNTEGWCRAAHAAATACDAGLVLVAATTLGRDLAPALAATLEAGYAADCTGLDVADGSPHVTRPVYAGKANATVTCSANVLVAGTRPNAFAVDLPDAAGASATEDLTVELGEINARVTEISAASKGIKDVAEADIIVAGGRGVGSPEGFAVLEQLAEVLDAAVGASRAVVDLGWRPHAEQVGQTGKVVSPKLYIACGVSGAIQHLAGIRTSKVIVAINKDATAPIFKVADYGIEGDLLEVVPALTEALQQG
jgi:electron transfer flavoprotein alpha subunit